MNKCSFCAHHYLPENFIYKGKTYKTCAKCLISKAEKRINLEKNNIKTTPIETISSQALCNYIAKLILDVESNNEILFEIRINFHNDIFLMANFDDLKSIVRIIIDKLEGYNYIWSTTTALRISTRFNNVATYYFACSQSMDAIIKLHHDIIHDKLENVSIPEEIKQEIRTNLHLDPAQIRAIFRNKYDILNIIAKQIHYWWLIFTQESYKMNDDQIISACTFLKSDRAAGCKLCFELITNKVTAIGFLTP
ncbi:29183_t:CDS:2 [Gigaspora margarita]|uniref:29183_t:CDS:1 n=1 Tax=Gigaspora margarita TaxID=4874 RepID=A0ABN7WPS0_GIGMA|nr:29183_t:CDS:2 [Gigaspora margarita]